MSAYTRIISIDEMLKTEEAITMGRNNIKSFTRKRKMDFYAMATSIIYKKGQTLSIELNEFAERMKTKEITKQAYSKQRKNINPRIFKEMNERYIKKIYEEIEVKKYKGYILILVDGSTMELPNSKELKEYYGISLGQKGSVGRVRARTLGVYDSLNKIMVKANIDKYDVSEKEQIINLLDEIKDFYREEQIIMVFDRYYFGTAFVNRLEEKEIKYIIRMKERVYKKEKAKMKSNDEEVKLKIRTNSIYYAREEDKKKLKEKKEIKTRIVKIKLNEKEEEHISTNLTKEEMNEEELKKLYQERWKIEQTFDIIKNKINIENFSSKSKIGVEQEYYAQIMVYNMLEDLKREAGERIEKDEKKKYEYKINMNIMAGIFKKRFMEILIIEDENERKEEYKKMIEKMGKYLVAIKPGRKYPRRKMHSMNKYRSNLRRNV